MSAGGQKGNNAIVSVVGFYAAELGEAMAELEKLRLENARLMGQIAERDARLARQEDDFKHFERGTDAMKPVMLAAQAVVATKSEKEITALAHALCAFEHGPSDG